MKARFVGGLLNGYVIDIDIVIENGMLEIVNYTDDLTELRSKGILVHRKELDNQPIFKGYLSPMWDGDMLRYETYEIYKILST